MVVINDRTPIELHVLFFFFRSLGPTFSLENPSNNKLIWSGLSEMKREIEVAREELDSTKNALKDITNKLSVAQ